MSLAKPIASGFLEFSQSPLPSDTSPLPPDPAPVPRMGGASQWGDSTSVFSHSQVPSPHSSFNTSLKQRLEIRGKDSHPTQFSSIRNGRPLGLCQLPFPRLSLTLNYVPRYPHTSFMPHPMPRVQYLHFAPLSLPLCLRTPVILLPFSSLSPEITRVRKRNKYHSQ